MKIWDMILIILSDQIDLFSSCYRKIPAHKIVLEFSTFWTRIFHFLDTRNEKLHFFNRLIGFKVNIVGHFKTSSKHFQSEAKYESIFTEINRRKLLALLNIHSLNS